MTFRLSTLVIMFLSMVQAQSLAAQTLRVTTDIAPVHSLVSIVMGDIGSPTLLISESGSPHHASLKPSQAKALDQSDVLFWMGPLLNPWLGKPVNQLVNPEAAIDLLDLDGTHKRSVRDIAVFEHDDHNDDHDGHDTHQGIDPHAWLDPENAKVWLGAIADTLSELDEDNRKTYMENSRLAQIQLDQLSADMSEILSGTSDNAYIVYHDAYQYFENRFHVPVIGSISLSDASDPSAARISQIQSLVKDGHVNCVFSEPQFNPQLIKAVFSTQGVGIAVLDPLGSEFPKGPSHYPSLLRNLANSIATCTN